MEFFKTSIRRTNFHDRVRRQARSVRLTTSWKTYRASWCTRFQGRTALLTPSISREQDEAGEYQKKALLIISDSDNHSRYTERIKSLVKKRCAHLCHRHL